MMSRGFGTGKRRSTDYNMHVLLTGGAGFIGSHLLRAFIDHPGIRGITVVDNLITGQYENIAEVLDHPRVTFIQGDIRDYDLCCELCRKSTAICHQAALGSVPRSIDDPIHTHSHNVDGTLNLFEAARQSGIKRIVFASSSSVYGNHAALPKVEAVTGIPLSPYAVTKTVNELYAENYGRLYNMEMIGLRYFNIFGPRQSPGVRMQRSFLCFFVQQWRGNPRLSTVMAPLAGTSPMWTMRCRPTFLGSSPPIKTR